MSEFVSKEVLGETCMDGGKCHHKEDCTETCFRRECCEPLTLAMEAGLTMQQWRYPQTACGHCAGSGNVVDTEGATWPCPQGCPTATTSAPNTDLTWRTDNAIDQLKRYGGHVANSDVAEALERLTDLNDDLWNIMHPSVVKSSADALRAILDKIDPPEPVAATDAEIALLMNRSACQKYAHSINLRIAHNEGWNAARSALAATTGADLTETQVEAAAKKVAEYLDYPWDYMPEEGKAGFRKCAQQMFAAVKEGML